jgi:hypothetical protein
MIPALLEVCLLIEGGAQGADGIAAAFSSRGAKLCLNVDDVLGLFELRG